MSKTSFFHRPPLFILLSRSNAREALLGLPCTAMQVIYWTTPGGSFSYVSMSYTLGAMQSTTWRHVWWGPAAVNVFYSEQRDFVDSHIDTPAFLFSIILGSAFHAFIILSTWPKATWPHHLSPCGYLYLYSSLSIYLPYAPMCLPPSRACCERNCVCSSIWQSDAKTQQEWAIFF